MAISDEIKEKEGRVRDFLRAKGLKALLLKRQANFSWLTAGGLNLVGITTEVGAASLLITETGKYVITSNIEAPRMAAEENLEAQGYEIRSFPWYEEREADLVAEIVGAGSLGSDVPFPQCGCADGGDRAAPLFAHGGRAGPLPVAGGAGLRGARKNGERDRARGEGVGGRRKALQRTLEGPDRSRHVDVGGRRSGSPATVTAFPWRTGWNGS